MTDSRNAGDGEDRAATSGSVSDLVADEAAADPVGVGLDEEDLERARRGDHDAFARLYDRHAAVVLSLCRRWAGASPAATAEAEDALQETFLRAHRLLDTLDDPRRLRSWLLGIARRVCSEGRRAAGRRRQRERVAMTRAGSQPHEVAQPGSTAEGIEALDRLELALAALPDQERLAIHLYYLDIDPVAAAQDTLGLSRSGFYKLLARAREHLARLMQERTQS